MFVLILNGFIRANESYDNIEIYWIKSYYISIMRVKELEKLFKSLGNRRRLQIVKLLLKNNSLTVSDIAGEIKLSIRSTSKHLLHLLNVDVLEKEQRSKNVYYKISKSIDQLISGLIIHIHHSHE